MISSLNIYASTIFTRHHAKVQSTLLRSILLGHRRSILILTVVTTPRSALARALISFNHRSLPRLGELLRRQGWDTGNTCLRLQLQGNIIRGARMSTMVGRCGFIRIMVVRTNDHRRMYILHIHIHMQTSSISLLLSCASFIARPYGSPILCYFYKVLPQASLHYSSLIINGPRYSISIEISNTKKEACR